MKPRLCLYTDSHEPSGMGEHMVTLAAEMHSHFDITFLCHPASGICRRARSLGLPAYDAPADYWVLKGLIERLRPDIFHGHAGIGWEGHLGVRASKAAGVRVVLRTEHLPYLITKPWQHDEYMSMQAATNGIICVSEESRRDFHRAGVALDKLSVVRNGIRPPHASESREDVLTGLGLPANAKLVLTVGRLTHQKGHIYLLRAALSSLEQHPNAFFLIAGVGHEESKLREEAKRLGITANVLFLGRRTDVPALMSACDLFVLPSLFEGLPLVALEAMSLGRPVVGTEVCGTSEAVVDGVTGRLVPPKDAHALATAIIAALDEPQLRARWGEAGKARVAAHFTAERMARETAAVYSKLLAATNQGYASSRATQDVSVPV